MVPRGERGKCIYALTGANPIRRLQAIVALDRAIVLVEEPYDARECTDRMEVAHEQAFSTAAHHHGAEHLALGRQCVLDGFGRILSRSRLVSAAAHSSSESEKVMGRCGPRNWMLGPISFLSLTY